MTGSFILKSFFDSDSLQTTLCLQFKPQYIASAAIYLASRFLDVPLSGPDNKEWYDVFDVRIDDVNCMSSLAFNHTLVIAQQILDLYPGGAPGGNFGRLAPANGGTQIPSSPLLIILD